MKINQKIKYGIESLIVLFVIWAGTGIFLNSNQVESITVTLLPEGIEHKDKVVLGVGKSEEAADYNLRVRFEDKEEDLGSYADTPIETGLNFFPNESIPIRSIQEVVLLDLDKLESDILERGPVKNNSYSGNNYKIEIDTERNLEAGFLWFFATPVGLAILTGIGIAVFLIIISNVSI